MPLALTHRVGDDIVLSEDGKLIGTIHVSNIRGDKVRLAYNLPKNIRVDRDEMQNLPTDPGEPPTEGRT